MNAIVWMVYADEGKEFVKQLGVTPARTAELEKELAIASDNLDIVHAQGVAKGKGLGRKELGEELAELKDKAKKTVQEAAELVKELRDELIKVDADRNHHKLALEFMTEKYHAFKFQHTTRIPTEEKLAQLKKDDIEKVLRKAKEERSG
ncbi:MAG: hypothetical protein V3U75_13210 [Methylococcaceae bacterium]